jgi:diguanylate cyclase (GGDEF)-like protein
MSYRVDMLEATLDQIEEAVVIIDSESNVLFWNKTAAELTGYPSEDVIANPCPALYSTRSNSPELESGKPNATTLNHKSGYAVPGMLRVLDLRDPLGQSSGKALLFYPIDELDNLASSDSSDSPDSTDIERSHADMNDRLEAAHHQWVTAAIPFGLLWITVDQAECLRTSHGRDACESMLRIVQQTLSRQMKPAEIIGRWGISEFLVLTHERTADLLIEHARRLAGIARTADFRWWGDRIGLTVSIGAAFTTEGHSLRSTLNGALNAMHSAVYAGGNQVVEARGF